MIILNIGLHAAAYVKVNCDATMFTNDVGWIARDLIVIRFGLKNLNILFVKRSENKTAICLARFLFLNEVVIDSSRVCMGFNLVLNSSLFVKKKILQIN